MSGMALTRTTFSVPDIRCDRCKAAIEEAVAPMPGVSRVRADVRGWVVTVDHDPALADASAIAAAVEAQGYRIAAQQVEP
jgi:copper chaperone